MRISELVNIPFDLERAKRIASGHEPGLIVTDDNCECILKSTDGKVTVVPMQNGAFLIDREYSLTGEQITKAGELRKINLRVPNWTQYKEGDVVAINGECIAVIRNPNYTFTHGFSCDMIFRLNTVSNSHTVSDSIEFYRSIIDIQTIRYANENEKNALISRLRQCQFQEAKDCLLKYFHISVDDEYEFLEPVLVRDNSQDLWKYGQFTFFKHGKYYVSGGNSYAMCCPYTDITKDLLGTSNPI